MKYKYDMVSIGDATIDTFLFVKDIKVVESKEGRRAVISWGDKLPVQKMARTVAGNATNNAVGSARLGLKTAFYTVVAHDTGGREIIHKMKKEKVDTTYIAIDERHGTNASSVLSHDGERTIFVYHEHRHYKFPKFASSKWLYLTSMGDGFEKIHNDLANYVDKNKVQVGFNPGTFQLRKGVKTNKKILERTALLSVNKEEAELWVGNHSDIEELCKRLAKLGPKAIALTDGRKGAYSWSEEGFYYISEYPGDRIEATGAGDSFTTAYIAALGYGLPHSKALQWGPINAGSVVMKIGPQEGLLTRKEIEARLKKLPKWKPIKIVDDKSKREVASLVAKAKA